MTDLKAKKGPVVFVVASLLSLSFPIHSALAESPSREQTREVGSKSAGPPTKRSGSAKAPAQKPMSRPDGTGNFVYEIINTIRAQSEELCARYGNPADCLEEAEVCLTMRDINDNQVRLCLNTVPGDSGDEGTVHKSRLRR